MDFRRGVGLYSGVADRLIVENRRTRRAGTA